MPAPDPKRLSINQVTLLQQWSLKQAIEGLKRNGVNTICVWREKLHELGVAEAARRLAGEGMAVSGLCPVGLIASPDQAEAAQALDDTRRALDEAAAIKAPCIVFVAGPVDARDKDIKGTRNRALERLATLVPHARAAGVVIGLEPLHPMICATRSMLSTTKLANDWCDALGAEDSVGIVLDTYAVWWDPELAGEIARAGKRICAFHINDWLTDTQDVRLDRGMMGDGVIDIPAIRAMVDHAGYGGAIEVEIFSARNWWKRDPDEVVGVIKQRFATVV